MLIANSKEGDRIRATPETIGFCPICKDNVIPKCGKIKIWHWAHKHDSTCHYGEGMTFWHLSHQNQALEHGCDVEVILKNKSGIYHIADIVQNKRIIELQHSNITTEEIIKRSDFYTTFGYSVDWVIDCKNKSYDSCEYVGSIKLDYKDSIKLNRKISDHFDCLFYKKYGRIFLDIRGNIFLTKEYYTTYTEKEYYNEYFEEEVSYEKKNHMYRGMFINNLFDT